MVVCFTCPGNHARKRCSSMALAQPFTIDEVTLNLSLIGEVIAGIDGMNE